MLTSSQGSIDKKPRRLHHGLHSQRDDKILVSNAQSKDMMDSLVSSYDNSALNLQKSKLLEYSELSPRKLPQVR